MLESAKPILKSLTVLNDKASNCSLCHLRNNCNQVVVGKGSHISPLLILSEAPDKEDDIMGEPLSGRPGLLLNKYLKSIGISREEVYLTHTVKCKSEKPDKVAIAKCKIWLWQEINLIKPKIIITLGKLPSSVLLRKTIKLENVVGKIFTVEYMTSKIMPWYHPNYLLNRGKDLDNKTIDFFAKVKEQLNVTIS